MRSITSSTVMERFITNIVGLYQSYDRFIFELTYDTEKNAYDEILEDFCNKDLFGIFVGLSEVILHSLEPTMIADAIVAKLVLRLYEEEFHEEHRGGDTHEIISN